MVLVVVVLVGGVVELLLLDSVLLVAFVGLVLVAGVAELLLLEVVVGVVLFGGVNELLFFEVLLLADEEPDGLVALLLELEEGLATFAGAFLVVVFRTDVFVDFLTGVLLVLSSFCASTVKAKNNIAIMMLKFFMTFLFRELTFNKSYPKSLPKNYLFTQDFA